MSCKGFGKKSSSQLWVPGKFLWKDNFLDTFVSLDENHEELMSVLRRFFHHVRLITH